MTPCSLLVHRRFREIYCLHHHDRKISQASTKSQTEWAASGKLGWLLVLFILRSWRQRQYVLRKRWRISTGFHGVTSLVTAVRISDHHLSLSFLFLWNCKVLYLLRFLVLQFNGVVSPIVRIMARSLVWTQVYQEFSSLLILLHQTFPQTHNVAMVTYTDRL